MRFGIVAQPNDRRASQLAARIRERLETAGHTVHIDEETAAALDADDGTTDSENTDDGADDAADGSVAGIDGSGGVPIEALADRDLVVSIGGDGTFLFAARRVGTVPILGVNLGEVGFMNVTSPDGAVETVLSEAERMESVGKPHTQTFPRLRAVGHEWTLPPAVNEVVVHADRRGRGGGAGFEVSIDGEEYLRSHADGVLVATPIGSSAYNLSEGGPLVRPGVEAIVVSGMAAADPMPSLVTTPDSEVTVRTTDGEPATVVGDGRVRRALEPGSTATIRLADEPLRIAGPPLEFFTALEKLE